jgi:hypothetical protein
MPFNGNEGSSMTVSDAGALTASFRSSFPGQPLGYFFGANNLKTILAQSGCMGIRIYFGATSGTLTLVLVGASSNENDQCAGMVLDAGVGCPPNCGTADALNS